MCGLSDASVKCGSGGVHAGNDVVLISSSDDEFTSINQVGIGSTGSAANIEDKGDLGVVTGLAHVRL